MSLSLRILVGFLLVALGAIYLLLNPILDRVERQYLEAAEEPMVDTAEILAAIVSHQLSQTGKLPPFMAEGFEAVDSRMLAAKIYSHLKTSVSMDAYVTDGRGIVVFDSSQPGRVGEDHSLFNNVRLTLEGKYGARSSRLDEYDDKSSIMYVGAPLLINGRIVGTLTVYKPQRAMRDFIEQTKEQIVLLGVTCIAVFLVVGILLSRWVSYPLVRLTRYAEAVSRGERPPTPRMPGRQLRILGDSVERMRDALEDRRYVENYVQTLSHEMKAPVAAIRGAAELLDENLPPERRKQFTTNIRTEAARLQNLADQLLALSSLESRKQIENPGDVDVTAVVCHVIEEFRSRTGRDETTLSFHAKDSVFVRGDEFLIETAVRNLVQNAIDFSPTSEVITVTVLREETGAVISVHDRGPGIPEYAVSRVFDRFYSLPRPASDRKSSGLGLCFVREAAALHGGSASLENAPEGGAIARLRLPAVPGRQPS